MEPILKRIVRLVKGLETTEERSVLQRAGRSLGGSMSKILIYTEEIAHALGQTGQENLLIYKGSGIDIS